jgi:hypothetical protein
MPVVLDNAFCSCCGGRHKLCYPDDDSLFSSRDYEYECPSTKRVGRVPKDEWGTASRVCPQDAILVHLIKT